MDVTEISMSRKEALARWREYNAAAKKTRDRVYRDMKKTYGQLRLGRKVIDILDVFERTGVNARHEPRLGITRAGNRDAVCRITKDGECVFYSGEVRWKKRASDVSVRFSEIPDSIVPNQWGCIDLRAPVPVIPPQFLPDRLTDDYYVLWEVHEWKPVPPVDPMLLRRISPNIFVVVAQWDLTPIERMVMKGRI